MKHIVLAVLLASLFVVPSFSATSQDEYVFILGARGNPYWTSMTEAINSTGQTKNIHTVVYLTDTDRDAEGQLNICQTAIQRKPKMLVMEAINSSIGIECFKQAIHEGIPVADVDMHLTIDEASKAGINLAFSVGSDNFLIGQDAAKFATHIATQEKPKVLVLEGAVGSPPAFDRAEGFRSKLKELKPNVLLTSLPAEWDRSKALTATTDFLQRTPDLEIIYAVNDAMALGALEAVRNAGKAVQVKIIGVDGTKDARKAIEEGRLTATVAQLPYLIGQKAVELAVMLPSKKIEVVPTLVLTKDVLSVNQDPLLQYVR